MGFSMTTNKNYYKLRCLIKTDEIQYSTQCNLDQQLLVALATGNSDIILYYKKKASLPPMVKRIPWFQEVHKQIAAFCFDSRGHWLLCSTLDGSLYIVPALVLIKSPDKTNDKRWKTNDVTHIPCMNPQLSQYRPTAITWWRDARLSLDIAVVGTEYGAIVLIDLSSGRVIGVTYVDGSIKTLNICQTENNEGASLLITNKHQQQWRLLIEQDFLQNAEDKALQNELNLNGSIYDNAENSVSNKSRLQEFKQLSVGKLAVLKQKLNSKSQSVRNSPQRRDVNNKKNIGISVNPEISNSHLDSVNPKLISKDTFLSLQYEIQDRQLYTCYHPTTNHITVHSADLSDIPLSVHKVFGPCEDVVLAQRVFFLTDASRHTLYVMSSHMSETGRNTDLKFNSDCILAAFSFKYSKEVICAIYKVRDFNTILSELTCRRLHRQYTLLGHLQSIKLEPSGLDTCIVITNRCMYEVTLRNAPVSFFMDLAMKRYELEKAEKLAISFGLNKQILLEIAGDLFLSTKEFTRAVACYEMSKCKLLKSILKFASAGFTSELVTCLTHCLLVPTVTEMPVATRMHLSNLCVLAFFQMVLNTCCEQPKATYKAFLNFLSTNMFYDVSLAMNMAGKTFLWEILHYMATQRNLYGLLLGLLMDTVQATKTDFDEKSYGFLICLSEPGLMQEMLINNDLAKSHMFFIQKNLPDFEMFALQRLVTMYDPTNPVLRPRLIKCKAHHRMACRSSHSDSIDSIDHINQPDVLIEGIIETFILVLLSLIHKKGTLNPNYGFTFLYNKELLKISEEHSGEVSQTPEFKRRSLSAGFSHVALYRNANVYTWGSSAQGCLGTGPCVLQYGAPHAVCFFQSMKIEVLSVSCGHCHTLAVTNNGVYAWGGNQFGQLGLGKLVQCSNPELIVTLAEEIIVDAVAGQYHSVALTADGRVFTWGWAIHGQLGHGNTEQKIIPALVVSLLGVVVRHIDAGYAHTLVLSADGVVYAFGCNLLGQLGTGGNTKSSLPVKVSLPDGITLMSTGYFHNIVVSNTNKLYVWGASPQVLKSQAQAQKRSRMQEQQEANERRDREVREAGSDGSVKLTLAEMLAGNVETRRKPAETSTSGFFEEDQAHLMPVALDTSLVRGEITQISAGCHHNALITEDGCLYTWGRNLDGQIGNGTRREVPIPAPLYYNSACTFAQVPPRRGNDFRSRQQRQDDSGSTSGRDESSPDINEDLSRHPEDGDVDKERTSPTINAVVVACGYDYTIAIQPGGMVLGWGNNSRVQLGRISSQNSQDTDDKFVLLKASKRVVRLPHSLHSGLDIPSQVPGIPTPVISYQIHDASSLAGLVRPLSIVEKSPGELRLHYVLENFHGLYRSSKIMQKCVELENYRACSKIAALERNILQAFTYELKVLHALSLQSPTPAKDTATGGQVLSETETSRDEAHELEVHPDENIRRNTELFNRRAEQNLMESLMEGSVARKAGSIPTSRSLNNLQGLIEELYTFDDQGGAEGLCKSHRDDESGVNERRETPESRNEEDVRGDKTKDASPDALANFHHYLIAQTAEALKFYLHSFENEPHAVKCEILRAAIGFWIAHDLPIRSLEDVLRESIRVVYYPLGLLLFCQIMAEKYLDEKKPGVEKREGPNIVELFSTKFCLQVLSKLLQHIEKDENMFEYIKILSSLMADLYGTPLNGYPGTSGNNTAKQMIEGIVSMMLSEVDDSRLFAHIKDPEAVHSLLATDEDKVVFTCGHHFPAAAYNSDIVPRMETELLTSPPLVLPCTSQYLGRLLAHSCKPEIVCPVCVIGALRSSLVGPTSKST